MIVVVLYNLGDCLHTPVVNQNIDEGWEEGCGEGELHSTIQLEAVVLNSCDCEGDGVMIDEFTGFESSRYYFNGIQDHVAYPVSQC